MAAFQTEQASDERCSKVLDERAVLSQCQLVCVSVSQSVCGQCYAVILFVTRFIDSCLFLPVPTALV